MAAQRPVITIEMSTTFLRPFTERTGVMIIKAEVVSRGKTLLVLKAEARSGEGKLIATSTNHSLIVADESLGR
jgi:acyl-coenzyme A thioesterase PaaI-like protein